MSEHDGTEEPAEDALAVPTPTAPPVLTVARIETYIEHKERFVEVGPNMVELEKARSAPALFAEGTKRIGLWQEWGLRTTLLLGVGAYTLFWPGEATPKRALFAALAVCIVAGGKPILEGVGSLLSAVGKRIRVKPDLETSG